MPRYNVRHAGGENESDVPDWTVTYPARCNGHLGDLGFVASRGYGGSDFVHFGKNGEPYGFPLTKKARQRLIQMRHDFGSNEDRCVRCGRDVYEPGMVRCAPCSAREEAIDLTNR